MSLFNEDISYQLRIQPLRRDPSLANVLVKGMEATLSGIIEDPYALDDVTTATAEILDNIYRHADWSHRVRPSFYAWYEVLGTRPFFHITSGNMVSNGAATKERLEKISSIKAAEKAEQFIQQALTSNGAVGGLGLLQLVASKRCKLSTMVSRNMLDIEVTISVPEMRVKP